MKLFPARSAAAAAAALLILPGLPTPAAVPEPPQIDAVNPPALRSGITNHLVVTGKHLHAPHTLWTTWSGPTPIPPRPDAAGEVEGLDLTVPLPRSFPAGIEMSRLVGSNGVSNPLLLLVDDLPAIASTGTNLSAATAQRVPTPVAIDGTCTEQKSHYFKLPVRRGRRLSVEVVAHRLGHPTDPVLRLLDSNGDEILYVNDTVGLGSDCAFEFLPKRSEELLLELRDAEYSGGEKQRYRLRIGDFPAAVTAFPPGIDPARASEVRWESTISTRTGRAIVFPNNPVAAPIARLRLSGRDQRHAITPRSPIEIPAGWTESEPNNTPESANLPGTNRVVHGAFGRPGDLDWYQFDLDSPGPWRFEVKSRRLGFPCDPLIRLLDASGATIATASTDSLDPWIGFEFKKAGTYRLVLEEAAERAGPGRSYQLRLLPGAARFRLSTETDVLQLHAGSNTILKLKIEPDGHEEPIAVQVDGLPEGIAIENPVIERKKKEWELRFRCAASVPAGTWGRLRISARPEDRPDSPATPLRLDPAMRKHFPELLALPPGFAGDIWFCAVANEPAAKDSSAEKSPR